MTDQELIDEMWEKVATGSLKDHVGRTGFYTSMQSAITRIREGIVDATIEEYSGNSATHEQILSALSEDIRIIRTAPPKE